MSTIDYKIETEAGDAEFAADQVRAGDVEHLRPLPRISVHAFCETQALQAVMERCLSLIHI